MQVVLVTRRAVATVCVVQIFGVALVRAGVITRDVVNGLSTLVQNFFLPASIFVRMGGIMTMELLREMWLLPIVYISLVFVNMLVARTVLLALSGSPVWFQPWFILTVSFPNMVAIPLIFVREICEKVTFAEDGVDLQVEECVAQGELFLYFAGQLVTLVFWIIGPEMVARSASPEPADAATSRRNSATTTTTTTTTPPRNAYARVACEDDNDDVFVSESRGQEQVKVVAAASTDGHREHLELAQGAHPASADAEDAMDLAPLEIGDGRSTTSDADLAASEPAMPGPNSCLWRCAATAWRVLLRPPTISQLVAAPVALIPALHEAVFGRTSVLQPVTSALSTMSLALVPCLNLVVSGSLGLSFFGPKDEAKPPLFSIIPRRTLVVLLLGRMVLLPLVSYTFLCALQPRLFANIDNSLMMAVMFMSACTPTSNGSVVLLTMSHEPDAADALSIVILGQYLVGIFSMTAFMVFSFSHLDIAA